MTVSLTQYYNETLKVEVDCTDHRHEVEVKVINVFTDDVEVEAQGYTGFCSQRDCFTGWMRPSDEVPGLDKPPLVGADDDGYSLSQL